MLVGPGQDALQSQPRQVGRTAYTTPLGEQARQTRSARKAALALGQGAVDAVPCFAARANDRPGRQVRPGPRAALIFVRPGEDLLGCQPGQVYTIAYATLFNQESCQAGAARQPATAL